jgi:beta-phosphoglucomutase-like phosphatase (HAD superfamily)
MSYFKKATHVRAETEAAERVAFAAKQKEEESIAAQRRQRISRIISELKPLIATAIASASENRYYNVEHNVSKDDESWEALNHIANELQEQNYASSIEEIEVNHGDSAAPAICYYYVLKISWKDAE